MYLHQARVVVYQIRYLTPQPRYEGVTTFWPASCKCKCGVGLPRRPLNAAGPLSSLLRGSSGNGGSSGSYMVPGSTLDDGAVHGTAEGKQPVFPSGTRKPPSPERPASGRASGEREVNVHRGQAFTIYVIKHSQTESYVLAWKVLILLATLPV